MAIEDIGPLYKTSIPGLAEPADIQEALKLYHYGSKTAPTQSSEILRYSIAGHLKASEDAIAVLQGKGLGSAIQNDAPTGIDNGFVWVDKDSSAPSIVSGSTAIYQNSAPTTGLVDGLLWVDKDSSPLTMYVYDLGTTTWREIGA